MASTHPRGRRTILNIRVVWTLQWRRNSQLCTHHFFLRNKKTKTNFVLSLFEVVRSLIPWGATMLFTMIQWSSLLPPHNFIFQRKYKTIIQSRRVNKTLFLFFQVHHNFMAEEMLMYRKNNTLTPKNHRRCHALQWDSVVLRNALALRCCCYWHCTHSCTNIHTLLLIYIESSPACELRHICPLPAHVLVNSEHTNAPPPLFFSPLVGLCEYMKGHDAYGCHRRYNTEIADKWLGSLRILGTL